MHEGGFEVRAHAKGHQQHRVHLRHRQRRCNTMARGVAQDRQQALVDQRQVERVPAGEACGPKRPEEIVTGKRRHGGGQRAHLHDARHFQFLAHLLALEKRCRHAHALQRDRTLRRQCRGERLVVLVEGAARLVEDLHDAHQHVLVVDQRKRQHASCPIPRGPVHFRVEALVGIAVGHVDDPAVARACAHDPGARRHTQGRDAGRDLEHQFVPGGVVQPHRTTFGLQYLLGRVHHLGEHGHEIERGRQFAGDREDGLHVPHRQAALGRAQARRIAFARRTLQFDRGAALRTHAEKCNRACPRRARRESAGWRVTARSS